MSTAEASIIIPRMLDVRDQNAIAHERNAAAMAAFRLGGAVGGRRYGERYGSRYGERYGDRYGVGAQAPSSGAPTTPDWLRTPGPNGGGGGGGGNGGNGRCPPRGGQCDPFRTSSQGAGHGRPVNTYVGGYTCEVRPPKCDCHVIGANTLNRTDLPTGIVSAGFADLQLDSGDADYFIPYYMFITALEIGAVPNLSVTGAPLMVLLQDSRSGQEPNLRRASTTDPRLGIATLVYGQDKDLECVDWTQFASVNRQQLTLRFFNPNEVSVHIFVDLWGIPAIK
jgi:hypothetical protein